MKQILWFRRDLRIEDNAILAHAKDEVLPIFIFDVNILEKLKKDDKRVTFIYKSVLNLKKELQEIGLDLAIFYGKPQEIFLKLKSECDEILCSIDFDKYARQRDEQISMLMPLKTFLDSFIIHPKNALNLQKLPYKVYTPFYNSLKHITSQSTLDTFQRNKALKKAPFNYSKIPTLKDIGFEKQTLPSVVCKNKKELLKAFETKVSSYEKHRDLFYKNGTSNFGTFLRFGVLSPREVFNHFRKSNQSECFIKELFWREFYNTVLYHFPQSEFQNFKDLHIHWNENEDNFSRWCEGQTGVPIVDASMRYLNQTGLMPNRLRMVVASFLTKNLFIDWRKGEEYFSQKLLDYEASSNVGSWQWSASTGSDAVPYFRVFNPYSQSKKFDPKGIFIKSVIKEFENIDAKYFHVENGVQNNLFINYPKSIVDIKSSRVLAIKRFQNERI